jgi:hypothetical protein
MSEVKFFVGYGTGEKCIHQQDLESIPRTDERVLLDGVEFWVEFVRWHLPSGWCRVQLRSFS